MKLVSMKSSPADLALKAMPSDSNQYPYGLCICLDNDTLKKLGIKEVPEVGTKMKMEAMVFVTRTSERADTDGEYSTMDLQITDLGLSMKKEVSAEEFYKKSES